MFIKYYIYFCGRYKATLLLIMSQLSTLSATDSHILEALFDAETSPRNGATASKVHVLQRSSGGSSQAAVETTARLREAERDAIAPLNDPNVPVTASAIQAALDSLNAIVTVNPQYASAYVNRSQVLRMSVGEELFRASDSTVVAEQTLQVFEDLERAIELAGPQTVGDSVSSSQADILATAYTHRGYLLLAASKAARSCTSSLPGLPSSLAGLGSETLEEMASKEFAQGARYGSKLAQDLAVRTNPYAKMCGAIVREALKKEMAAA